MAPELGSSGGDISWPPFRLGNCGFPKRHPRQKEQARSLFVPTKQAPCLATRRVQSGPRWPHYTAGCSAGKPSRRRIPLVAAGAKPPNQEIQSVLLGGSAHGYGYAHIRVVRGRHSKRRVVRALGLECIPHRTGLRSSSSPTGMQITPCQACDTLWSQWRLRIREVESQSRNPLHSSSNPVLQAEALFFNCELRASIQVNLQQQPFR